MDLLFPNDFLIQCELYLLKNRAKLFESSLAPTHCPHVLLNDMQGKAQDPEILASLLLMLEDAKCLPCPIERRTFVEAQIKQAWQEVKYRGHWQYISPVEDQNLLRTNPDYDLALQ